MTWSTELLPNNPIDNLITCPFPSAQGVLGKNNSCLVFKIMALIFRGYLDCTLVLDRFTHNLSQALSQEKKNDFVRIQTI